MTTNLIPKVIVYSTLFPSLIRPVNGLFVAELVKALSARIHLTVVAPVIALKNMKEILHGQRRYCYSDSVAVKAPICFNFPKVLKSTDGYLMAMGSQRAFKKSIDASTRLVHAHFAYPDAVAAGILASKMGLPLVVTVHGSDIKILAKSSSRRSQIVNMLQGASAIVAVANDLVEEIIKLGIHAKKKSITFQMESTSPDLGPAINLQLEKN